MKILLKDSFGMQLPELVPEKLKVFDSSYAASHGPQDLYIKVKATHAGLINGNYSFYVPYRMAASVDTWTKPYPKPFNPYHYDSNNPADPVGRVISAKYVDTSSELPANILKDARAITTDMGEDKLYKDIGKLLRKKILLDDSWEGFGYIELLVKVVDPDTIQKILDGRLMTGSVAASSDSLVCYQCKHDIKYGHCGHMRGMIYEDEVLDIEYPNFYVYGKFEYLEMAVAHIPADRFATWEVSNEVKINDGETLSRKVLVKDCMAQVTSVFAASREEDFMTSLLDKNDVNIYEIKDSLEEVGEIMSAVNKDKQIREKAEEILVLAKKDNYKDILVIVDAFKPESVLEKSIFIRVHNSLHDEVKWAGFKSLTPAAKSLHAKIHSLAIDHEFEDDLVWVDDALDLSLEEYGVKSKKMKDAADDESDAKDEDKDKEAKDDKEKEPDAKDEGGKAEEPEVKDEDKEEKKEEDAADEDGEKDAEDETEPSLYDEFCAIESFDADHITDEMAENIYVLMIDQMLREYDEVADALAGDDGDEKLDAEDEEDVEDAKKKKAPAGGSNAGKYSKSDGPFCGPSGGAPKGTYPVGTKKRAKAALAYARHAPNPAGIKKCVCRHWPSLPSCKGKKSKDEKDEVMDFALPLDGTIMTKDDLAKLHDSVFCGPNRSFPVTDAAHYWAVIGLLDAYSGKADISRIKRRADRRAKALGIDTSKRPELAVEDNKNTPEDFDAKCFVKGLDFEDLMALYNAVVARAVDEGMIDEDCPTCKELEARLDESTANQKAIDVELQVLRDEVDQYADQVVELTAKLKELQTTIIIDSKIAKGELDKEDKEAIEQLKDSLMEQDMEALDNSAKDAIAALDIGSIAASINTGLSDMKVDNPLIDGGPNAVQFTQTMAESITAEYITKRMLLGRDAAEMWLSQMKDKGIVPMNFIPEEEKE